MTDESFLRYRLEVVLRMPESPQKTALVAAIIKSLESARAGSR